MKELREKLHQAIDKYGPIDERTIAISQKLDNLVCEAQKLIVKEGLSYIEKEKLISGRVGAHKSDNNLSKTNKNSITEN